MLDLLVIGSGYVGLVSSVCFSEMGFRVISLDINPDKIKRLSNGELPIYEAGLEEMLKRNLKSGRLSFTCDYAKAVAASELIFLAVDTPMGIDGTCDLKSIKAASRSIAQAMNGYKVIINKSTVPVGTARLVQSIIKEELEKRGVHHSFDVVSNPEFLKEGCAVNDFMKPDRVIIGAESARAENLMREVYRPFMLSHDRLFFMDIESAELTKYAANTMLALRISYMNWLSCLCEKTGANIASIRKGIGSDKRIGYPFLWAGAGYGGSCLPKDIRALQTTAESLGLDADLIRAIDTINSNQKQILANKIIAYFTERAETGKKCIAVLGLAFKPDTDDMREAPALTVIEMLLQVGYSVRLYDPVAVDNAKELIAENPAITWCSSSLEATQGADAIALVTEWKEFRLLDFKAIKKNMKGHAFFDGRNQYNPQEMAKWGFDYFGIGLPPSYRALASEMPTVHDPITIHTVGDDR